METKAKKPKIKTSHRWLLDHQLQKLKGALEGLGSLEEDLAYAIWFLNEQKEK